MKSSILILSILIATMHAKSQPTDLKNVFPLNDYFQLNRYADPEFFNKDTFMIYASQDKGGGVIHDIQITYNQGLEYFGFKSPIGAYGDWLGFSIYINTQSNNINVFNIKTLEVKVTNNHPGSILNLRVIDNKVLAYTNKNIYISYDTCKTWLQTNSSVNFLKIPEFYTKDSIILINGTINNSNTFYSNYSGDNGLTWKEKEHTLMENYCSYGFGCIDPKTYYYLSADFSAISWSFDGGDFFSIQHPITDFSAKSVNNMVFANERIGYIIVDSYDLYKTRDGGKSWQLKHQFEFNKPIYKIKAIDSNNVFFLAYGGSYDNVIYVTHNGLETITEVNVPTNPTIEIFPNPARQSVAIQFAGAETARLRVIGYTGQVVISQNQFASGNLSIEQLPAGIYLVELEVNGAFVREKLVVER